MTNITRSMSWLEELTPLNDCAGEMDKEVLWIDLVGNLKEGLKGPYWELRDSHLKHWSLQIHRKDRATPFQ